MKQVHVGMAMIAGVAALSAIFVFGLPVSFVQSQSAPQASSRAPDRLPQGQGFDFYVLALSWSPTYCQGSQARKRDALQCNGPRPFAFVVHGLWPQFERGYPRACQTSRSRPSQSQAQAMLDIMPSERLVQHEWETHGTCSGLSAVDYLTVVRAASQQVRIPDMYKSAPDWRRVQAGDVEAAFVEANPDMTIGGISVAQRSKNLSEVRLCLTRDLRPRSCPEVDRGGVDPNARLSLPPSRG